MDKKKWVLLIGIFLVVQSQAATQDLQWWTSHLEPSPKVSLNKPEISFLKKYDFYILCMALLVYRLDAIERCPKEEIKERITSQYDYSFFSPPEVNFDLDNIDYFLKKGFTRYYLFYVEEKPYIIRIFRTDERCFQPKVEVLYEGSIENPPVTFQILKGVNAILEQCDLKPQHTPSKSTAEIYP